MDIVSAEQTSLDMALTQIGAKVTSIHGLLCFVRYYIDDTELYYVYNINAKNQYYLQRVLPYPVGAGVFAKPDDIVEYIKNDIKQFENASNSSNFEEFIETTQRTHQTVHAIEEVFMNYNVSPEKMQEIDTELSHITNILENIKNKCVRIVVV